MSALSPAAFFLFICIFTQAGADNVIITGTSLKVKAGTTIVLSGNLLIKSGAILDNSGSLILKNNLSNENVLANPLGSGLVEFSGLSLQSVSGLNIIRDLNLNNTTGIILNGDTWVNGVLTLAGGKIACGSNNLFLGPAATIGGSPSVSAMIIVTGTGQLRKEFSSAGSFTFPVGDITGTPEYSPLTLSYISGSFAAGNYAGVTLVNSKYPDPGITGNYLNRYWTVTQSGISGFSCNATFQYLPADVNGNESLLSCSKVNPLPLTTYSLTNTGTHMLSANGITSSGSFTGMKSSTTPQNQVLTNIDIGTGITNCYDALQVLTVAGGGNTFTVEDGGSVTLVAGERILILPGARVISGGYLHGYIATDGHFCGTSSNPLVASVQAEDTLLNEPLLKDKLIKIYPNPTTDLVRIELSSPEDVKNVIHIVIYSIQGQTLLTRDVNGASGCQFSLSGRAVGVYIVHAWTEDTSEITRIVKR